MKYGNVMNDVDFSEKQFISSRVCVIVPRDASSRTPSLAETIITFFTSATCQITHIRYHDERLCQGFVHFDSSTHRSGVHAYTLAAGAVEIFLTSSLNQPSTFTTSRCPSDQEVEEEVVELLGVALGEVMELAAVDSEVEVVEDVVEVVEVVDTIKVLQMKSLVSQMTLIQI
jgi:hypothetical protein